MDVRTRLERALGAAYSIDRELAGGGMSHVYVAEERAFGRRVVVKLLREDLTEGASAERFKREIAVAAKLQHPHIVPLLTAGEDGGTLYYTMPFVEGESLRARLQREGELPVHDVVRVLREIASALSYAHRRGIVHRDIKPENVLFSDGSAVVTDFGIAKALEAARTEGDARASTITKIGVVLGTPAYMAPEQAAGDPTVDHRADLYALGCVAYELLTGRPPFDGRVTRQLLAAHATETPVPITVRRANTPPSLATLVMHCLEKHAADRPQSAAEVLRALEDVAVAPPPPTPGAAPERAGPGTDATARRMVTGTVLIAAGVAAGLLAARAREGNEPGLASYDVGLSDDAPIVFRGEISLSIAPRGDFVVYVSETPDGVSQLRYRSLHDSVERIIPGTDGAYTPQISPDGRWVAFMRALTTAEGSTTAGLEITGVNGEQPRSLGELHAPRVVRWVSVSRLYVLDDDGVTLRWFDPQSGEVGAGTAIMSCLAASSADGGRSFLCGGGARKYGKVVPASGERPRFLRRGLGDPGATNLPVLGSHFRVIGGRYLVYVSIEGDLRAARFDRATLEIGRPVTLVSGIRREGYQNFGQYDIADNGALVYAMGDNAEIGRVMVVRPGSDGPQARPLLAEPAAYQRFDLSPDERRLAAVMQERDGQKLRIYDIAEGRNRTWLEAPEILHALWSPRGDRIVAGVFNDSTSAIVIGAPDAAGPPDTLVRGDGERPVPVPMSWRSDSVLIARMQTGVVVALDPRLASPRLDTVMRYGNFPNLSPNGRLLLYHTQRRSTALITPLSTRNSVSQIAGAFEAFWSSATVVRYRDPHGGWFDVRVDSSTGRVQGEPRKYFSDPRFSDTPGWSHRPASNGGMIYVQGPARTTATYLRVVPNWVAKMKRVVDASVAAAAP